LRPTACVICQPERAHESLGSELQATTAVSDGDM
jgi:hypothetical protein